MNSRPLIVDLDGTLIHTDMLHESTLQALCGNPFDAFRIPYWLAKGKAKLKESLAQRIDLNPKSLPYNDELLSWLKKQKQKGRSLILCTASDHSIAQPIADHLGIFDDVIASDGTTNLAGNDKADVLEERYGRGQFDYAGNSDADLAVWSKARNAILVNAPNELINKAKKLCDVIYILPPKIPKLTVWLRVLRVHQWLKNLLLFVPIFAAHQLSDAGSWVSLIIAFFAFSLCASSVYIINDLLDLESDRLHSRKRKRPFASGEVPIWVGVFLAPCLLAASLSLSFMVNDAFLLWLVAYFSLTTVYSLRLKRLMLIDCMTLAILYTLRIIAGAAAVGMSLSFWLLAFSVFLFLSLAFVKRYTELVAQPHSDKGAIHGRGYFTSDAPLLQMFGIAAGYASIMVFALYLNSNAVVQLYQEPELVWSGVLIMLFWISWMWMQAHRGNMHDDPLVFAMKDKVSLLSGLAFSIALGVGASGWSW